MFGKGFAVPRKTWTDTSFTLSEESGSLDHKDCRIEKSTRLQDDL
jgi:hypothetical protein